MRRGEAVLACAVDLLVLLVVALAVGLARHGALWWILTLEIAAVQWLLLAHTGRTLGLWVISATAVVPRTGAAPGIARAGGRILLAILLPIRAGGRPSGGGKGVEGLLLDRITGTLTVTRRPSPQVKKENPWLTAVASGQPGR